MSLINKITLLIGLLNSLIFGFQIPNCVNSVYWNAQSLFESNGRLKCDFVSKLVCMESLEHILDGN